MKFVILVLFSISAVLAKDGECPTKSDIFKPPRHLRPMFCKEDDQCPDDLKCCPCHSGEVYFCVPPAGSETLDKTQMTDEDWNRLKEEYMSAYEKDDDDCDDDHDEGDEDDSDEKDDKMEKEEYYKKDAHAEKRRRCHERHHRRKIHAIAFSVTGVVLLVAIVVTVTCCIRRRRQRMNNLQQKKSYIQTNIASAPNTTLTKEDLKAYLGTDFSNPMYQTVKPEETVNPQ